MATDPCPGCGLTDGAALAVLGGDADGVPGDGTASPLCRAVRTALAYRELADPLLAEAVHQLTVDAYGVQHHGPSSPPIGLAFGLAGLHLALDRGRTGLQVREAHTRMAARRREWPSFGPAPDSYPATVADALADDDHVRGARAWAEQVWAAWTPHHEAVDALVRETAGYGRG